ncbi:glycosyltransferase [Mycolicibacterium parafortuitum]|uniref:4,4'-diaponeurosporenoate glycosyltransferase n=1 Tax=Mycolicibacterium parafortuitum TaxID=39692 RepID=A0A375YG14_MYCPF|nr:glycosyltransferase family 2 protein [Mycolicibacterium parafortuitum]ORB28883.1 glycosyl transferase [Mycolicibacterium parafortuitum]SRX79999.1 glycosyl transferase [Psychrobacter sp. G] [Mycolicibacterium parafortuitum]
MTDIAKAVVVVPAHNENDHLPDCLRALTTAALCLPIGVTTVVVLDSCDDGSEAHAGAFGPDVHFVSVEAGNVGAARAAGFEYARTLHADVDPARTWYATTDADSAVDADWLVRMIAADADMVLGVVRIPAWRNFSPAVARRYLAGYRTHGTSHRHIHGANMGFRADAYWHVGGFRALASSEDVDLVRRFEAAALSIHRDRGLSVATSDRSEGRAPGGFAQHLRDIAQTVSGRSAEVIP